MSIFCQQCQKEAASVHVTEINKEGQKVEVHLCEGCAKTQGVPQVVQSHTVFALFKELMEKTNTVAKTRDRQCPQCGMSFGEFKAKGRFGCAHDYEVFLSRVVPLLDRIHGSSEHVSESEAAATVSGSAAESVRTTASVPGSAPLGVSTSAGHASPAPAIAAPSPLMELKRLRRDLQRVIKHEQYEEAARIRDRIQMLEKQLEAGGDVDG